MWRDFPAQLAAATGRRVLAYSRRGYGGSDPAPLPRPIPYMQHEGEVVLPAFLDALGVREAALVGHSDGASIAIVHAGAGPAKERVRAAVLLAPHVFAEPLSIASIREAKRAYDEGDLRAKLARFHGANTDCAFRGWNDAWLDPRFHDWTIESYLPGIRAPVLVIQGEDDRYGTLEQVDAIQRGVPGGVARLVLPSCGHDPAREARDATLAAIRDHLATALL
jgi:pimeloyl-ACP methyl ester carboxylesterase